MTINSNSQGAKRSDKISAICHPQISWYQECVCSCLLTCLKRNAPVLRRHHSGLSPTDCNMMEMCNFYPFHCVFGQLKGYINPNNGLLLFVKAKLYPHLWPSMICLLSPYTIRYITFFVCVCVYGGGIMYFGGRVQPPTFWLLV